MKFDLVTILRLLSYLRLVVHNGHIVVRYAEVLRVCNTKVILPAKYNIVFQYFDVTVSTAPGLLVIKSYGMAYLMNYNFSLQGNQFILSVKRPSHIAYGFVRLIKYSKCM